MKKILALSSLFFVTLAVGIRLRDEVDPKSIELITVREEDDAGKNDKGTRHSEKGEKENGPEEFLKFHLGIRTRSDQEKPGYPTNYQWQELQKTQLSSPIKKLSSIARTQSGGNGVISFTERGPGNVPGRTRGLIVDPDDPNHQTWFAGSASGGIWKTTNAGTSWQWLTPSIPNLATTTLVMAASNHSTIYAGTGEGFGLVDAVNGSGIFKSTDRGVTWNLLSNSVSLGNINRLAVDPSNENNILAAANSGIFHSTDGGNNWTKVYSGVIQDLRPTPGGFSPLYATQYGVGVLKSMDGITWNLSNAGMSPNGRVEIAISPVNPNRIIASAEGSLSSVNSDLYLSNDGGSSWYLVAMTLGSKTVDYLSTQGWYDNTVAFSPYNQNVVYVGGVTAFQVTLGSPSNSSTGSYTLQQNSTSSFLNLVNFGASSAGGILDVASSANQDNIQVIFGPGKKQKAHMFFVPSGATSGVPSSNYTYKGYVDVPFQVWNKTTNQQLMVSFRDQTRDSTFVLLSDNTTSADATQQSREYIFINNVPYDSTAPNPSIATSGGQTFEEMFMVWPELASGATWTPNALPNSNLSIVYQSVKRYTSSVVSVADPYDDYDGKNQNVHPDQHNIYPISGNSTSQTFQLLMANDGGLFLSGTSTSPGTTQGEWTKVGNGYNTSQFYGVDKKPGAQEYLGGMQDNSTYFTPSGTVSSAVTPYNTNAQLAGDGFEVVWHSYNSNKMIGGAEYNYFSRSLDGGATWTSAFSGLTLSGSSPDETKFPFISKLASSKQAPDILFTVGSEGVWKSTNFGGNWTLTSITSGWGLSSFADVEVSRANANIVWAGSGMGSGSNLFVSTNAGKTFNAVPNPSGITLGNITRIATHPTNEKIAYALFSFAKTAKILMTQDLGQTWTDISGFGSGTSSSTGFPDVAVYSLYVRPDNTNIIWAGTDIGIVESLDGGATWATLSGTPPSGFPNVAVWDMKGQDSEVVIATHGRGIWTAELSIDQNGNYLPPVIVSSGTSPQSKFMVQAHLPYPYDSVQLIVNSHTLNFIPADSGTYNIQVANVSKGNASIQLVGYKGDAPIYSNQVSGYNLTLLGAQEQYSDYFITTNNFYLDGGLNGLSLKSWGASNLSMQSPHRYATNQDVSGTLIVPIIVSSGSNTFLSYQDVAIVVPGISGSVFGQSGFNDYVVVEGTKDGITWIPIANGYNASANTNWLASYNSLQNGSPSETVTESFNLKNKFTSGDTLLFRFRLHASNQTTAAWGWSVDNLYIQQTPTGIEPGATKDAFDLYPNPSTGKFSISYSLSKDSPVSINVFDVNGRSISSENLGTQLKGIHQFEMNLESSADGVYLVKIKTNENEKTSRVLLRR